MLSSLGLAAVVAGLAGGCANYSSGQVQQVKEVEPGTYSIGISRFHGLGATSAEDKALSASVDKAGEYCHAKGQKLLVTTAVGNSITFRCISGNPSPQ